MFEGRAKKAKMVGVMLTATERRTLERIAAARRLSLSEFSRQAIGEAIRRIEETEGVQYEQPNTQN